MFVEHRIRHRTALTLLKNIGNFVKNILYIENALTLLKKMKKKNKNILYMSGVVVASPRLPKPADADFLQVWHQKCIEQPRL